MTRGGAIDTVERDIYSAQRREYPAFNARIGQAQAAAFFGMRPVISAHIVTDAQFDAIRDGWVAQVATEDAERSADPLSALAALLEDEVDPRRKQALSDLQLSFRMAQDAAQSSTKQAAKSTLISGAAFVETLIEDARAIRQLDLRVRSLRDQAGVASGDQRRQVMAAFRGSVDRLGRLRAGQATYLLSYRSALEALTGDVDPDLLDVAYQSLAQDLIAAEQVGFLRMLRLFWRDLEAYRDTPDMGQQELLTLAIR